MWHTWRMAFSVCVVLVASVLVVTGCKNRSKDDAVISPSLSMPAADFTADVTSGSVPLTVQFTDKSTGNIDLWEWDFDSDGTIDSTQQNPSHTYNFPGTYTISLSVSSPDGLDTEIKINYIVVVTGDIQYVDGNTAASGDGASWSQAFKTIQEALDAAADYDLVLVADYTYKGTGNKELYFRGKKVHLKSQGGAGKCIIDCEDSGRGFYFHSGETGTSIVEGFTIRNGNKVDNKGGGIFCENSSPTIIKCILTDNVAMWGGGIFCMDSQPVISNCKITGNNGQWAGGIGCLRSDATISNCLVIDNTSFWGAGIYSNNSYPTIINCTISNNTASNSGGGFYCC